MTKQRLFAAILLAVFTSPAVFAHDWWDGKYKRGHHYTWDEWRSNRSSWEAEHRDDRHWNEERMRREWERHKHQYRY